MIFNMTTIPQTTPQERQILDEVVTALHGHYGARLSRVALFGSRARRDHAEAADYDILVVLRGIVETAEDMRTGGDYGALSEITLEFAREQIQHAEEFPGATKCCLEKTN